MHEISGTVERRPTWHSTIQPLTDHIQIIIYHLCELCAPKGLLNTNL